jgi:hypothetical protein
MASVAAGVSTKAFRPDTKDREPLIVDADGRA